MANSPWPMTGAQLREHGYAFAQRGSCRSCGAAIVWAKTPKGKRMPLVECTAEASEERSFKPHFDDCPQGQQWSRR